MLAHKPSVPSSLGKSSVRPEDLPQASGPRSRPITFSRIFQRKGGDKGDEKGEEERVRQEYERSGSTLPPCIMINKPGNGRTQSSPAGHLHQHPPLPTPPPSGFQRVLQRQYQPTATAIRPSTSSNHSSSIIPSPYKLHPHSSSAPRSRPALPPFNHSAPVVQTRQNPSGPAPFPRRQQPKPRLPSLKFSNSNFSSDDEDYDLLSASTNDSPRRVRPRPVSDSPTSNTSNLTGTRAVSDSAARSQRTFPSSHHAPRYASVTTTTSSSTIEHILPPSPVDLDSIADKINAGSLRLWSEAAVTWSISVAREPEQAVLARWNAERMREAGCLKEGTLGRKLRVEGLEGLVRVGEVREGWGEKVEVDAEAEEQSMAESEEVAEDEENREQHAQEGERESDEIYDDYYITEPHAISPSPTLASSELFRSDLPSSVSSTTTTGCSASTTFTYSRPVNIPTPSTSSEMVSSDTLTQHHYNVHQSHLPRRRHQPTSSFGSKSISPAPPMPTTPTPTTEVFPATLEMSEEEGRTEGLMLSGMNGSGSASLMPCEREAKVGNVPQSSETFRKELQKRNADYDARSIHPSADASSVHYSLLSYQNPQTLSNHSSYAGSASSYASQLPCSPAQPTDTTCLSPLFDLTSRSLGHHVDDEDPFELELSTSASPNSAAAPSPSVLPRPASIRSAFSAGLPPLSSTTPCINGGSSALHRRYHYRSRLDEAPISEKFPLRSWGSHSPTTSSACSAADVDSRPASPSDPEGFRSVADAREALSHFALQHPIEDSFELEIDSMMSESERSSNPSVYRDEEEEEDEEGGEPVTPSMPLQPLGEMAILVSSGSDGSVRRIDGPVVEGMKGAR